MGQVIFELDLKPQSMRSVVVSLCEHAAHMASEGHKS